MVECKQVIKYELLQRTHYSGRPLSVLSDQGLTSGTFKGRETWEPMVCTPENV